MEDNNTTEDLFKQTILVELNVECFVSLACGADYANKLISTFGHSLHEQLELFEKEMIELKLSSTVENTQILPQDDADEQAN
ncbi:hypothetical protein T06_5384 [Trichinella sp. T6]|nr:hypothetical protein T06_5384 [Trichinella sp. T6]